MVQDDSATVSRSVTTNHADGAERTAEVGSPDRDVGRSTANHRQCIPSGSDRGSHPDSVPDDYVSELSDTQSVDRSQTTSFLFQFTEDTLNRDSFKKHLVPAVFSRFRN